MTRNIKRFTAVFLIASIIFALLPVIDFNGDSRSIATVDAVENWKTGYCGGEEGGNNLSFVLDSNGVLTISGTGEMTDASPFKNDTRIVKVVLESGVTTIGKEAFSDCKRLTTVEVPATVSSIGQSAFYNCELLRSIVIPEGVRVIEQSTFENCKKLSEITLPSTLKTIKYLAFNYCSSLTSVDFPEGLTTIEGWSFWHAGLTSLSLPKSITVIKSQAFAYTYISEIIIPDQITEMEAACFYDIKVPITKIEIGNNVKKVQGIYSSRTDNNIDLDVPDNVEELNISVKGIKNVRFGKKISKYNSLITDNYNLLNSIEVDSDNPYFSSYDGNLYNKDYTSLLWMNYYKETVTFPKELNITEVPVSFALYTTDIRAGRNVRFEIESPAEHFATVDGVLYSKDMKTLYSCPVSYDQAFTIPDTVETIKGNAFSYTDCSISFPSDNHIKTIGINAFYHASGLPYNLVIPEGVEEIERGAFGFRTFSSVTLPDSLLSMVNLPKTTPKGIIYIGKNLKVNSFDKDSRFVISEENPYYCTYDNCVYSADKTELLFVPQDQDTINVPKQTTLFKDYPTKNINVDEENEKYSSFHGALYNKARTSLVYIPNGKTLLHVPKEAYDFQSKLKTSNIDVEVEEGNAEYSSYDGCLYNNDCSEFLYFSTKRTEINFPKEVRSFNTFPKRHVELYFDEDNPYYKRVDVFILNKEGTKLFWVIDDNEDVVIPDGVVSIERIKGQEAVTLDADALRWLKKAKTITMPEGLKTMQNISYCENMEKLVVPGTVKVLGIVTECTSLRSVEIGEGVEESLGFYNSRKLTSLELPSSCKYFRALTYSMGTLCPLMNIIVRNPNCVIDEGDIEKLYNGSSLRISAYCGSPMHKVAVKRRATFTSLGHSYLDWYVSTPASYESEGVERRDCAYCEHFEERAIPKLVKETNTATFMADGKEVSKVEFTSAMETIEEPAVPAKDRYLGEWEPYTLGDKDIVINAKYTLIKAEDAQGIDTESNVDYYYNTDDVQFNIKASSKAKTVKSIISQSIPLDIVLVVDQSGSMDEVLGSSIKKVDALKDAAGRFVNRVAENARLTGADHRIAIAGFGLAGKYSGFQQNENTELLTNSKGSPIVFHEIKPSDYASALLNVISKKDELETAIASIDARGATAADLGLEMAKNIYANSDSTGREKVVIFMTDGEPTYSSSFQTEVANTAIQNAFVLKNTYGASVYSLGVFGTASTKVNQFMNAVSSDYPNAVSYNGLGAKQSDAYYTTVNNTDSLSDVFHTITTESLSHTAAFDKLTLIKTLSKYVTLTSKQEQDLRVSLIRKYGITTDDISVVRKDDGTTEIKAENLTPYEVENNGDITYEASMSFFASLNENAQQAGAYTVDTEDSGVMLGRSNGYEATFSTSQVTLESVKTRTVYKINNEVYDICEDGSEPDISSFSSDWAFSGWTGDAKEKNATLTKAQRTIVWTMSDETVTQTYEEGSVIIPPRAKDKSNDEKFLSWNKSIPTVMPDENLEFTAVYGGHVHKYVSEIVKPVSCEEDGITRYTCDCGETYTETIDALGHNYEAVTSSKDKDSDDVSRCSFVCTHCGQKYDYALNYQVRESSFWTSWSRMLFEFDLTDDNLDISSVQPDGTINIRIPLNDLQYQYARNVYVTRIENGHSVRVPAEIQDGYLIIKANHFSPYDIMFADENTYITSGGNMVDLTETFQRDQADTADFGINGDFKNLEILGVQIKSKLTDKRDIRYVAVIKDDVLQDAEDYGFIAVSGSDLAEARENISGVTLDNAKNVFRCKDTDNSVSGEYGKHNSQTDYKYVTFAVNNIKDKGVAVMFYVKDKNNNVYYATYTNKNSETFNNCSVDWDAIFKSETN